MNKRTLREQILSLALDYPFQDRHALSSSHICYAPWMVPFGAKGIGNFPDDAFIAYKQSVEQMVASASERDLELWLVKFKEFTGHEI